MHEEDKRNNLTKGPIGRGMLLFALPYLLSCFMQTFYGMADLFVVGLYYGPEVTTAVSVGSQVMHMLTVIIAGLAIGVTVMIGRAVGAGEKEKAVRVMGTSVALFAAIAVALMVPLLLCTKAITQLMMAPQEAVQDTQRYLAVCFAGIPFIVAYNVISSMFRGAGDSKRPMYFVGIACVVNILLDFLFIGVFRMGAMGAAVATVLGQAVSVFVSVLFMQRKNFAYRISKKEIHFHRESVKNILRVGIPVAMQDGLIQVAFIVITVIANSRGLIAASAVGIVEKLISFLFLVPSAFLSAITAITAQNIGAGKPGRAKKALGYGLMITVGWGVFCFVYSQFLPETLVGLFTKEQSVISAGCEYLKAYSADCIFAAIHFCFSGYFCGIGRSGISFFHNILSILLIRIPGAYLASIYFPETLYPMGWAAPMGSLLSALICVGFYVTILKHNKGGVTLEEK